MLRDIKCMGGELVWENGDFAFVEEGVCVVQDVRSCMMTERGALFYAPDFGEGIPLFLQSGVEVELKARLLRALQQDSRIVSETAFVSMRAAEEAEISFEIHGNPEPINLAIKLGKEGEVSNA